MEKEKVLEIEITKIDDNYSYCKIKYQNVVILERRGFCKLLQGTLKFHIHTIGGPSFRTYTDIYSGEKSASLIIRGGIIEEDNKPFIIKNEDEKYIQEIVNLLNEKYGTPKRWRADDGERYYYIDSHQRILNNTDLRHSYDDMRYELGNYFQTEEEAQRVINSKEWKEFWEKVRNGEIGK